MTTVGVRTTVMIRVTVYYIGITLSRHSEPAVVRTRVKVTVMVFVCNVMTL